MFLKFSLLILQEGLTPEMFEDALKLPHGFLLAFEDTDMTGEGTLAQMGKWFMDAVNYRASRKCGHRQPLNISNDGP